MKIPCGECLVLAICRHKKTIRCDLLDSLAMGVLDNDESIESWWKRIHKDLPLAERIRRSKSI